MTEITANGSGPIQPLDRLFEMLATEPLDPAFERYGNFVTHGTPGEYFETGVTHIWGNFRHYSHVFNIRTDDRELVAHLTAAIRANQKTQAYKDARYGRARK